MLLSVSERFCETLVLTPGEEVVCDFGVSEGLLDADAKKAEALFKTLSGLLAGIWQEVTRQIPDNPLLLKNPRMGFSIILVTNAEIQTLNHEFRDKDKATDVLTFPVAQLSLAAADTTTITELPEAQLGEIYVSLQWAEEQVQAGSDRVFRQGINYEDPTVLFMTDRMCHGILHLLGVHHDTEARYNQVVQIQYQVANAVLEKEK